MASRCKLIVRAQCLPLGMLHDPDPGNIAARPYTHIFSSQTPLPEDLVILASSFRPMRPKY